MLKKIKIIEIGQVCCYCGQSVGEGVGCCGEVHFETGYVECDENLDEIGSYVILESELNENHEVVE